MLEEGGFIVDVREREGRLSGINTFESCLPTGIERDTVDPMLERVWRENVGRRDDIEEVLRDFFGNGGRRIAVGK